jgi:hypothetical chaperone protein
MMRLGIDFGTTNSAIALFDGEQLVTVKADPDNENPYVLPSLIFIDREQESVEGIQAAFRYMEKETGRRVQWQRRLVSAVEIVVAGTGGSPISYVHDLHALIDTAANGRLLQSIKTGLRSPKYEGTRIFDRFYTIDSLISRLLETLKTSAEQTFGEDCREIVLGRPVKFSDDGYVDRRAEEILYKAALAAGFEKISFALEPLAVVHLYHQESIKRHTALVFDFGGGTLDLTIAELGGDEAPNILANQGVLVGGDDLDKRIMKHLTKHFGRDARVGRERAPFPFDMLELLEAWQTMTELSQSHHLGRIREFQKASSDPRAMKALEHLVSRNLGYTLFREIERCKRELSDKIATTLKFKHGPIHINELITRDVFNKMIIDDVDAAKTGILQVMEQAGLGADQIDVVLRTGGSSNVPVFREMMADIFGAEKLKELDPMVSVVGGMAVIAQHDDFPTPPYAIRYGDYEPVSNIRTKGDLPYETYRLRIGEKAYVDDDYIISQCPATLAGLPAIRPSNRADNASMGSDFLSFDIDRPARVYIAYDPVATKKPEWVKGFKPLAMQVEIDEEWRGERALPLAYKEFEPGTITLGGNQARGYQSGTPTVNYIVVVQTAL